VFEGVGDMIEEVVEAVEAVEGVEMVPFRTSDEVFDGARTYIL
jgi:hypothetical protein